MFSSNHLGLKILQGQCKEKVPFCPFKNKKKYFQIRNSEQHALHCNLLLSNNHYWLFRNI